MSSALLIEIRIPYSQFRADDCVIVAEWHKHGGYRVTQGRVQGGMFSASGAAKLQPNADSAVRAALRMAAKVHKAMQRDEYNAEA